MQARIAEDYEEGKVDEATVSRIRTKGKGRPSKRPTTAHDPYYSVLIGPPIVSATREALRTVPNRSTRTGLSSGLVILCGKRYQRVFEED